MPIANVLVYALAGDKPFLPLIALSNTAGKFVLSGLTPGPNRLFTVLSDLGHLQWCSATFERGSSLCKDVEVDAGKVVTGVNLTMPRQAPVLVLGVIDADTKAPVLASRIHITRPDLDWAYYESSPRLLGPLEITLPRRLPFRLEVRGEGYQTWRYSTVDNDGKERFDLVMEDGERRGIVVELKKVTQAGKK